MSRQKISCQKERVNIKDVYNEETRELSIPVGEIGGNETYKVILDVKVNEKANNLKDGETLGLNIKVNGKTPTGETTDSKGMIVISPEEFKIGAEVADTGDSRTKDMIYIIGGDTFPTSVQYLSCFILTILTGLR